MDARENVYMCAGREGMKSRLATPRRVEWKERNAMTIGQFQFIRKERKIFFSVVAWRLLSYLKVDSLIDISVQKAGIPGFSGCLEHSSMIWHQIQAARTEGRDEKIFSISQGIFSAIQLCFNTSNYTTSW